MCFQSHAVGSVRFHSAGTWACDSVYYIASHPRARPQIALFVEAWLWNILLKTSYGSQDFSSEFDRSMTIDCFHFWVERDGMRSWGQPSTL